MPTKKEVFAPASALLAVFFIRLLLGNGDASNLFAVVAAGVIIFCLMAQPARRVACEVRVNNALRKQKCVRQEGNDCRQ